MNSDVIIHSPREVKYLRIKIFSLLGLKDPVDPCSLSPCGPYSVCRVNGGHAICSCQEEYLGSPPSCRPECMVSSECMPNKACINQRCADPCVGACGATAKCIVVNHNALCSCPQGYIGDPFTQCMEAPSENTDIFILTL